VDPVTNPFAPGAGTPPPELAGRDEVREAVRIALERVRLGRPTKSVLMVGLRGVGKTVLLDRMRDDAEAAGIHTVRLEAPEQRSLPALKVKFQDIEVGIDLEPEPGLADNGDLEHDLQALIEAVGEAAKSAGTALAIFIDELQYVEEDQLAALITALHRAAQRRLPIVLVGAGLPQLRGRMGRAKSYAERLFDFPEIGPLDEEAARAALAKPAEAEGVAFEADALDAVLDTTHRYPYFLQEWGKHAWETAPQSPIRFQDVEQASTTAVAALDEGFFRVRFDRLTPAEKRYLRAMAELGPGPHRSGDIAAELGRPVFDEFMKRIMPGDDWRE